MEGAEEDWDHVPFGDSSSDWDVVKLFYDTFSDFQSLRSFGEYDNWRVGDDQTRPIRRAAEVRKHCY